MPLIKKGEEKRGRKRREKVEQEIEAVREEKLRQVFGWIYAKDSLIVGRLQLSPRIRNVVWGFFFFLISGSFVSRKKFKKKLRLKKHKGCGTGPFKAWRGDAEEWVLGEGVCIVC